MRKLMMLAAMLAMVLVAAAPAFAQAVVNSDDDTDNSVNQYNDCTQIQAALAAQSNYGDANAAADDGDAVAAVSQDLGISQDAVLNCVNAGEDANVTGNTGNIVTNGVDDNGNGMVDEAGETAAAASSSAASSSAAAGSAAAGSAGSAAAGTSVLPDTGGASLFTLGAGALLVGGGLLARRIFR